MKFFKTNLVFMIQSAAVALCLKISPVIEKALDIASSTYALNYVTSVVWGGVDLEEVDSFVNNFHGTVVLTSMQNCSAEQILKINKKVGYKQTVFMATGVDEFAKFMTVLKPEIVVSIHLIFVFLNQATDAEIAAITKTALENDLADIVVVSSKDTENVELSTYLPYSKGICGNDAPVKIKSGSETWFPKKYSNFLGCPIRVILLTLIPYGTLVMKNNTVSSISGLDGWVFMMLIEKLNASMDVVSWKEHVGVIGTVINGTATDSFGDLVCRRADILAPTIIINYLRYQVAQISHIFQTIDVYWFGPRRQEVHEWLKILQPLMNDITPAIVTSFIFFIVVTKIVNRFDFHTVYVEQSITFQSFIIFLGQGVRFETKSWLVNCLFVMWIWCCMVVRIAYQGDLIDGFQRTLLEKPLDNLKEAVEALDGYGGTQAFREFYRGTPYFDKYKALEIGDIAQQMKRISDGKRFLMATDRLLAFEYGYGLQMMNEPISHAPVAFFMRPGWPAAKEIDYVIQRLAEVGFVQKALSDNIYEWKKIEHHVNRESHPLNMKTLMGCFHGLWVWYVICIVVLLLEIVYYNLTHKQINLRR